jgi:hypothetical protein
MMLQWLLVLVFIDHIAADSLVEPLQGCGARLRETEAGQSALTQILESRVEASTAADLKRAVTEHGMLVIPGASSLSPAAHVVFTSLFGVPGTHPRRGKPPGLPCLEGMDCLVEVASTNSSSVYFSTQTKAGTCHCPPCLLRAITSPRYLGHHNSLALTFLSSFHSFTGPCSKFA